MENKKKWILRISAAVLIALIVCTFLSKTIYNMMLPTIEITRVSAGNVSDTIDYAGIFGYTNTQEIRSVGSWKILESNIVTGSEVKAGDVLFTVDMTDADLEREFLLARLHTAEKTEKTAPKNEMLRYETKAARRALELHDAAYPEKGIVKAKQDGRINQMQYQTGNRTKEDDLICVIQTAESKPFVKWYIPFDSKEQYEIGKRISISFARDSNTETITAAVTDKAPDYVNGMYVYKCEMNKYPYMIPLSAKPFVTISTSDTIYNCVVPLSCLIPAGNDTYHLYTVSKRQGIFGEVSYLKQHEVHILEQNNLNAAIDLVLEFEDNIMVYSSKEVTAGSVVTVKE